jgi:hypothetical protein
MPTVIQVSGPINSGKSTVGSALARLLPDASFIDGDDHEAPDDAPLAARVVAALLRIEDHIATVECSHLVVAYPVDQSGYERLRTACERRPARFLVVTLAPPIEVALADRGGRRLTDEERQRIAEMYEEGYHARHFSDFVLDTSGLTAKEGAEWIGAQLAAVPPSAKAPATRLAP